MEEDMQNADSQPADEGSGSREGRSWQGTCPQDMLPATGIIHIQPCRMHQDALYHRIAVLLGEKTLNLEV